MGKSNKERQAAHRERMKLEGRRALIRWVTPQQAEAIRALLEQVDAPAQAEPLYITKKAAQPNPPPAFVVPELPGNMPESFRRDIRESEAVAKKKRAQIQKLEADIAAIEKRIVNSVAEWKRIK